MIYVKLVISTTAFHLSLQTVNPETVATSWAKKETISVHANAKVISGKVTAIIFQNEEVSMISIGNKTDRNANATHKWQKNFGRIKGSEQCKVRNNAILLTNLLKHEWHLLHFFRCLPSYLCLHSLRLEQTN